MVAKRTGPDIASGEPTTGNGHRTDEGSVNRIISNNPRQLAIKSLLETAPADVDDKLATVKTAHYVDKERFQSAFRSLMRTAKS